MLPGFKLTLGFTLFYLGLIVLIPLAATFSKTASLTWAHFWQMVSSPAALSAYRLSFGVSLLAALVNAVFGLIVAWVLVRYQILGQTADGRAGGSAVRAADGGGGHHAGGALLGKRLDGPLFAPFGIKISYTWLGIFVALTFIGLPFIVRTLQPVLEDLDVDVEEAAATLGANRWKTFFRVILPMIFPALLTGFAMAFARALGEYGSVVFISSNIPLKSQIVPVLIMTKLEQFDYAGATALAVVMLVISFLLLLAINVLQWWSTRHRERI